VKEISTLTRNTGITVAIISCAFFFFLTSNLCHPQNPRLEVQAFRLANGLRVILAPMEDIEAVCVLSYHTIGIRDDPENIRGASLLYQNLVVLPTRNTDMLERVMFIKSSGGASGRMVNYDFSIFYQIVPKEEVNSALFMERERITSLKLSDQHINFEKNKVYKRYYYLSNVNTHFKALQWVRSKVFEGTVYETPIYGNLEDINRFDNQAIKKLYNNFRDLSNIILVVTGNFAPEEIKKSINKYFSPLKSPIKPIKRAAVSIKPREKLVFDNWLIDNFPEYFVMYGIRGPAKYLNYDHLYFNFIRYYLLDPRVSELQDIINRQYNLDIEISHEFSNYLDANSLIMKFNSKKRINLEKAKFFVNKRLDALIKGRPGTISGSDLKMVKSLMEIDFLKLMTHLEERSAFLAENYHRFGTLNAGEKHLEQIRKITVYDVYRTARKYLDKNNRVLLNVYPTPKKQK
jgi:zinc protease